MASRTEQITARGLEILERLIAFDTTSRASNLALIAWVEAFLAERGIPSVRVPNSAGDKANLLATIGPMASGGVILSGHTDVVPIDGQAWASDPWALTERDGRLYGRGSADMKGFLALSLAAAERAQGLARPIHLAFSHDEEVGCLGAPALLQRLAADLPAPACAIIGEPTSMQAIAGHKGIAVYEVVVTGREAHSSLTHLGVSANMAAIRLMASLQRLAESLTAAADPASPYLPREATLTIGEIAGGTALNILARTCRFIFDLRPLPGQDAHAILAPFFAEAAALDAALKSRAPEAGVVVTETALVPALAPEPGGVAEAMARRLAGDNGPPRVASYVTEAGHFRAAGFSAVLCGPGSIDQAHQPDEYVERSQIERGAAFMDRLLTELSA